jgi:pantothenate kinase
MTYGMSEIGCLLYTIFRILDNKTFEWSSKSRSLIFAIANNIGKVYCMIRAFPVAQTTFTAAIFLS